MRTHRHRVRRTAAIAALLLAGCAGTAQAQFSGDAGAGDGAASAPAAPPAEGGREARRGERRKQRQVDVSPYLEVGQVLSAELKGGGDLLTYTTLAAGVDAAIVTRRAEAAATLRYEHRIGETGGLGDADILSGLARGRLEVARGLNLEGGALATRTRADGGGIGSLITGGDNIANVYSIYAGPTLVRRVGSLDVGAGYRFGYTKVDLDGTGRLPGGNFDSATNHVAWASLGQRPGDLPFGWQVSGGYEREDASQLDQRFEGQYVRADVTVPVGPTVALLGGVGYEDIEIGQRDPVLGLDGVPLRDEEGRFVTDKSQPRQLSFDIDGLIWDAGVMWRPSRRTSLTARVGRRYGDTIYTGSFSYRPDHATTIYIGVYDGLSSFGRGLSSGLASLPTQFDPVRNPVDGGINPCVFGEEDAGCLNPQFGSTTGLQFRNRGIQALYSSRFGRWSYGVGAGYDQRRLLVPAHSVLAPLSGVKDENYYLFLTAGRVLDAQSDLSLSGYLSYFDHGAAGVGDMQSAGVSAAYSRRVWRELTGTAAASLQAFEQDGFASELIASALVGLRYNF